MVEEEEHPKDNSEWKCERDPLPVELPETHEPRAVMCGLERRADWERQRMGVVELAPICNCGGRHECERHTVIGTEATHVPVEKRGLGKTFEEEGGDEHEECEGGGDECAGGRRSRTTELVREGLYAELEVRPGHVEAKGFTGKHGDILQEIAP